MTTQTIVIGGGITGLSSAWYLQQQGIDYTLVESGTRWGGKLHTDHSTIDEDKHFILDAGAESFITRKPELWQLAHELGIQDELITPINEARGIGVLHRGRIYPIPMSPIAFITSRLLSPIGKLRMLAEPFIPPRRDMGDETLANFAQRRLGKEVMERMIGPVLGGIYNADPHQQSVMVSAPHMRQLEAKYGGLFKGMLALMRQRKHAKTPLPPRFVAFKHGTDTLVNRLIESLTGDLRLNVAVEEIQRDADGYAVYLNNGDVLYAPTVILATTANVSAKLIAPIAPEAGSGLGDIQHTHIGTVFLAFRDADLPASGLTGLMIPRREQRPIDAILWTSKRMPERAPSGYSLLKIFFGGGRPSLMNDDDAQIIAVVLGELKALFNIRATPILSRVFRWQHSYPLAEIGHLDRVAKFSQTLPNGLFIAGSSYLGIGVPDCIRQGQQASQSVSEFLGQYHHISSKEALS